MQGRPEVQTSVFADHQTSLLTRLLYLDAAIIRPSAKRWPQGYADRFCAMCTSGVLNKHRHKSNDTDLKEAKSLSLQEMGS